MSLGIRTFTNFLSFKKPTHDTYLGTFLTGVGAYTMQAGGLGTAYVFQAPCTITLPVPQNVDPASSYLFGGSPVTFYSGWFCRVKNMSGGNLVFSAPGSAIDGAPTFVLPPGGRCTLVCQIGYWFVF